MQQSSRVLNHIFKLSHIKVLRHSVDKEAAILCFNHWLWHEAALAPEREDLHIRGFHQHQVPFTCYNTWQMSKWIVLRQFNTKHGDIGPPVIGQELAAAIRAGTFYSADMGQICASPHEGMLLWLTAGLRVSLHCATGGVAHCLEPECQWHKIEAQCIWATIANKAQNFKCVLPWLGPIALQ